MTTCFLGDTIQVLHTDNVVLRYPELVGCFGVVEQAPTHPSTWFTIKMTDGRLIKLQTTNMKPVLEKNDSLFQVEQNMPHLPTVKRIKTIHESYEIGGTHILNLFRTHSSNSSNYLPIIS
jgi:hypothetical protein